MHPAKALIFTLFPGTLAVAAETAPAAPATDLAGSLGQMVFGLGVVIALLVGCLWVIKRLSSPHGSAGLLKVLGATAVGPRERVVLVEAGDKVLVLGVAPGSVRTLHVMDSSELPISGAVNAPGASGAADFSAWLKKSLDRRHDAS